jgi:hypothetical protein
MLRLDFDWTLMLKHELSKALSKCIVATTDECGKCVSDPFRALHGASEQAGEDDRPATSHNAPGTAPADFGGCESDEEV